MVEKVISELLHGEKKVVTVVKSNPGREELRLRYIRF